MKRAILLLFVSLSIGALGACKEQREKAQIEIKTGNTEGGIMKKKYEEAQKEAAEKRKEAE